MSPIAILMAAFSGVSDVPFEGVPGLVSPQSLGEGRFRVATAWESVSGAGIAEPSGSDPRIGNLLLGIGWGVSTWTDFGVSGAYHFESGVSNRERNEAGFGDTWIHLRQQVPLDALLGPARFSIRGRIGLPTGERGKGVWARDRSAQIVGGSADPEGSTAFGGAGFGYGASAAAGLDLGAWNLPLSTYAEGGIDASTANGRDPEWKAGLAMEVSRWDGRVAVFGAGLWSAPLHLGDSSAVSRLRISAGASVRPVPWLSIQGDVWGALGSRRGERFVHLAGPGRVADEYRVAGDAAGGGAIRLAFDFRQPDPDADRDGVPDRIDRCPEDPEDRDGFQDADGCPDPDNDKDGVCDPGVSSPGASGKWGSVCRGLDVCPDGKEDIDGFEDRDGCPDPDNDRDGICDPWVTDSGDSAVWAGVCRHRDACPFSPEDADGFEDRDGCPDPDNDKDGVPDAKDRCPEMGIVDSMGIGADGCPLRQDPPVAEPASKERVEDTLGRGSWVVYFGFALDGIESLAGRTLDSVAAQAARDPGAFLRVEGHADSRGEAEMNQELSERRAANVVGALAERGVARERIRATGRGFSAPAELNTDEDGRSRNRRCVIRLVREAP